MNSFKGNIIALTTSGSLTLLKVKVLNSQITAIVIDTPETLKYLKINSEVTVFFKETEVIIGKGNTDNISMQNQFKGTIVSIATKALLSKLTIASEIGEITSIITTNAVKQLDLREGLAVKAMIKTNEILVSE